MERIGSQVSGGNANANPRIHKSNGYLYVGYSPSQKRPGSALRRQAEPEWATRGLLMARVPGMFQDMRAGGREGG